MPKVREAIRIVGRDGWRLENMQGSHRQFKHPVKLRKVTIPGHPREDLKPAAWHNIKKQAGLTEERP